MKFRLPARPYGLFDYDGETLQLTGFDLCAWKAFGKKEEDVCIHAEKPGYREYGYYEAARLILARHLKCLPAEVCIRDDLLEGGPLLDKGYPLTGTGWVCGMEFLGNYCVADIILTSRYYTHVTVSCNRDGTYDRNRAIVYYPPTPSFETIEKRRRILSKNADVVMRCSAGLSEHMVFYPLTDLVQM